MTFQNEHTPSFGAGWLVPVVAIVALVFATAALTLTLAGAGLPGFGPGMMGGRGGVTGGGPGMMGGGPGRIGGGSGMMGYGPGRIGGSAGNVVNGPQPGDAGFVAGTVASPRQVSVIAGPGYVFSPSTIRVARGETVTFVVTTMGPTVHEFMVGPADAVATDQEGTPEIAEIGMMQTKTLTYTFDGPGPFAFACHETGHYEAGMRGTIIVTQ